MRWIFVGLLLLAALVLALAGLTITQERSQYQERAAIAAQNISRILEQNIAGNTSRIDLAVQALAHEAERQLAGGGLARKAVDDFIEWQFGLQPWLDSLRLTDREGNILYGIGVAPERRISAADRDFFQRARAEPNAGLIISSPLLGRISGKWTVVLGRRVNRPDGGFAGFAYATITLDHFQALFASLNVGKSGVVSMRKLDLGLVARHPEPPGDAIGDTTVSKQFVAALAAAPLAGSFEAEGGLDGIDRTVSYRRIANYPAYLIVGLAADDYLAEWREDTKKTLMLVALFIVTAAVSCWLVARAWRRQVAAVGTLREQESKFRTLLESAPDAMVIVDAKGLISMTNRHTQAMLGYERDELLGQPVERLFPHRYRSGQPGIRKDFLGVGGASAGRELWLLAKDGRELPVSMNLSATDGGEPMMIAAIRDISERKRAEEEMQLASLVYNTSSEAMMVTDVEGVIITVNPAFTQVTGYSPDEVVGQTPRVLRSGRHDLSFYQAMWRELILTGQWQGEVWDRRKNGEIYPKWVVINTASGADGAPLRRVALFSDITEKKNSEEVIWQQANFDALTGLPNRQMFSDRLEQEIKKAHRAGLPMALLFLDLDRFKEVNDTLGHDMGDRLLKEAARRLTACVRESDTVARLGGDEFTLVLGELDDPASAERVAQSILRELARPFRLGAEDVYVTASIGVTFYPEDATDMDALLKHADQAMYAAKSQGRNRYSYFTASMQELAQARMRLTNDLRGALAGQQFRVFYQPIVELASGAVHKAEALIRWQHPSRGLVSPAEFIPIAEDTGMIVPIGDWVFYEVVRQVEKWRALYCEQFQISVNKSPVQFRSEGSSHAPWVDHLGRVGLPGQSIVVEITEGLLMEASGIVSDHLLGFRDAGVQVSLDDFGTGYSSLSYLKKFDIDYLKIDQSFVRNLSADSEDMALCEGIIVMAHKLGIKVIAEGVETAAQRDLLAQAGCDYAQGYLYSRPVPAEAFEQLLWSEKALA
ncbi:MAG: EAL domain-containing protein [Burkholderiaceae bacterium]|nr:EAL domain-containing protein [Burkholderiaceae bacterium]